MTPLPSPWVGLVLGLAAYRLTRLGGWDDWPPIARLRAWVVGERWIPSYSYVEERRLTDASIPEGEVGHVVSQGHLKFPAPPPPDYETKNPPPDPPGKTPDSEVDDVRPAYDRPLLAHLVHCPFCLGWWVSLATYLWWLATPSWGLYVLAPFALSGVVGIVAKNLDA